MLRPKSPGSLFAPVRRVIPCTRMSAKPRTHSRWRPLLLMPLQPRLPFFAAWDVLDANRGTTYQEAWFEEARDFAESGWVESGGVFTATDVGCSA